MVKLVALRCCQASLVPPTRFRATLIIGKRRRPDLAGCQIPRSGLLSPSSNPVNGLGSLCLFDAPRYARMSRSRYIAWRENLFVLIRWAMPRANKVNAAATATINQVGV